MKGRTQCYLKVNWCNAEIKQTTSLVRIILKRANKARLHYLIPAAQKMSTDATNTPRMETASKVLCKEPSIQRSSKAPTQFTAESNATKCWLCGSDPRKLTLLETPRKWVLQPLKSPRVPAGTHTDATLHRHIISKSFQLCMYLFLEGKAHFREVFGAGL